MGRYKDRLIVRLLVDKPPYWLKGTEVEARQSVARDWIARDEAERVIEPPEPKAKKPEQTEIAAGGDKQPSGPKVKSVEKPPKDKAVKKVDKSK